MKFISSDTHGIIDYAVGLALVVAPWLFGFANEDSASSATATWLPVAIGIVILGVSLMTQYRYSVTKTIAYSTHLVIDMFLGFFLAVSPWLFGFADYIIFPHVIVGLAMISISFFSVRMDSVNKTNRLVVGTVR